MVVDDKDPLARLEEKIGRAVSHIEKLQEKNSKLVAENKNLQTQLENLTRALSQNEKVILDLQEKADGVSEAVRERLEGLIGKIDRYEKGPV